MADPTFQIDPSVDPDNWLFQYRHGPVQSALGAMGDNADEAAEAVKVGNALNVPPSVVNTDLDHYKEQHRAELTSSLLEGNEHLRDYIRTHPLAASISNDDWGQLDVISKAMDAFNQSKFGKFFHAPVVGFQEKFGEEPLLSSRYQEISDFKRDHPAIWNLIKKPYLGAAGGLELLTRTTEGFFGSAHEVIKRAYELAGGKPERAEQFSRELTGMAEAELQGMSGFHGVDVHTPAAAKIRDLTRKVEPWTNAGRRPPPTADPVLAQAAVEEAKLDAKNFDDLYRESQRSSTLPRDADAFTAFGKLKLGDSTIGISADKVRELYGDARPSPDDSKLGWAAGIESQYDFALASGADVEVPFAEFLAKASPETYEAVKDGMRLRHGGLTVEEGKELWEKEIRPAEVLKEEEQTPLDSIRQAAGLRPQPALPQQGIIPEKTLLGEMVERPSKGLSVPTVYSFPAGEAIAKIDKDRLTGVPRALAEFFGDKLNKLVGDVPVKVVDQEGMGALAKGLDLEPTVPAYYDPNTHEIIVRQDIAEGALGHNLVAHVMMHEGAHAFTSRALDEFPLLKSHVRAMMDETLAYLDRAKMSGQKKRYGFTNEHEFIAEAFSNPTFQELIATTPISKSLSKRLGLGEGRVTVWDAIGSIVRDLIERLTGVKMPDTMLDGLMKLGPEFEAAHSIFEGESPVRGAEPLKPDEAALFKQAQVIGMTKERLAKHMELITKLREESAKFAKDQELLRAGASATKEWKDNYDRVREEVTKDLLARPDIAADRFLRTGELPSGQKLKKPTLKIDDAQLRGRLSGDYLSNSGVHPDSLANLFGFQSGRALAEGLAGLEEGRKVEGSTPAAQLRAMVDAETQRRMLAQYGKSAEELLADAKEQAISPTQMDLLHNELEALYEKTGQQPITKTALVQFAKQQFDRIPLSMHDSDKYLAAAGREGDRYGEALIDDKPVEALQAKQKQALLLHTAKLAMKLEKAQGQFYRLAGKYKKPEPTGQDPEVATFAQQMLMRVMDQGFIQRSVQGLARQQELLSAAKDFRSFVEKVNSNHAIWNSDPDALQVQRLPIADFLLDENFRMRVSDMTPEQFDSTFGALKVLDKYGRGLKKYLSERGAEDLNEVKDGLTKRMSEAFGGKEIADIDKPSKLRLVGSLIINPESWFKRLDLGNRMGPFQQLLGRPVFEGQYTARSLQKEIAKRYRDLGDFGDLREKIDNDLFMDPTTKFQEPMKLTKGHLYAILQNVGNELQRKKLAAGYGIDNPQKILDWLYQRTTREDWQRAQKLGKIFDDLFTKSEVMRSELYGWVPERIPLGEIQTPWGPMKEWYHPLIFDPLRHGALKASDLMDENGFSRPMPAAGYVKQRTGAMYPIQLNFNSIPNRLNEMINDIAMRPAITEVSKIVFDNGFRNAFNKYYGPEYYNALQQWLKDSAGVGRWRPGAEAAIDRAAGMMRENMSTLLIGWNLGTVLKHFPTALAFSMREVGPVNFLNSVAHMIWELPSGRERWKFAMENSEELQSRLRSTRESISATNQDLFKRYSWDHKFFTARDAIQWVGAAPVAVSDFISAVPMWDTAYRKAIADGATHGDAVYSANTQVRQTHGSSILAARAGIMRAGPLAQTFMPFYNFFSNALQRNYEMAWKAKLALQGRELSAMTKFEQERFDRGFKNVPHILGGFLTYGVIVSIIEELVDPMKTTEDEDPALWGAKVLLRGPMTMIPGVRDLVNAYLSGHEASSGLVGTAMRDILSPLTGLEHDPDHKKTIRQFNQALGALSGLSFDTLGKVGQYTYNVANETEEAPEDIWDFYKVLRHGTTKEPK